MKIFFVLLFAFQLNYSNAQDIEETIEELIHSTFGDESHYELQKYLIPSDLKRTIEAETNQKFFSEYIYIYKISDENNQLITAILDNVYGKEQPITFLVVIDSSGSVIATEIIRYREPYGGAVQNKSWNDQFKGKRSSSGFNVGQDIDGISGATISVKSVTKGVQKILLLYDSIKNDL